MLNERNGLNEPRNQVKGWDTNGCVWEQQSARLKEPRAVTARTSKGKRDTKRFILSSRVFSFGSRCSRVPPENVLFFIAKMWIDNVRLVYTEGSLWQTLVPWTLWCNNALWLIVLRSTEKPLSPYTYTLFAECVSFRRRAIAGAVNRKRKSNRPARPILTFCQNLCRSSNEIT